MNRALLHPLLAYGAGTPTVRAIDPSRSTDAMTRSAWPVAALTVAGFLAAPVFAQSPGTGRQEQGAAMSGTAGHRGSELLVAPEFVRLSASHAKFETESAKLALERSQDLRLRRFAQRVIEDHDKAQDVNGGGN